VWIGPPGLGVERRANDPTSEKTLVKKPSNGPRNWIDNGKRLELETGLKLGTWNIRTLNKPGAFKYVMDSKNSYKLDILALQETRWPDRGNMKKENTTFFYSETDGGKHENGVGFMVNEKVLHNKKTLIPVDDRICYIKIAGRLFDLVIINCYAPTENKDDETKDKFYDELERVVNSLPTHCINMIIGDLNAKVGRETMYRPTTGPDSLHETSNDNGTRLIHFATSKEFTISFTFFPRKDIHESTWISPNGRVHNQIDHIMIRKRHASCIRKVRTYRANADSDHYLLFTQFNLRLSTKWNMVEKYLEKNITYRD